MMGDGDEAQTECSSGLGQRQREVEMLKDVFRVLVNGNRSKMV